MRKLLTLLTAWLFLIPAIAFALVDLNKSSKAELESLPGVGPATAEAIMAARPFQSVGDLKDVRGIGDSRFIALRPLVSVTQERAPDRVGRATTDLSAYERININTASRRELERLPGIGPQRADAIIQGRPYTQPEDVMKVKGIKEGVFAKIKNHIAVQ